MTDEKVVLLRSLAKGSWQKQIIEKFITHGTIINPIYFLCGDAKKYSSKYETSFNSLLMRIKLAGFEIKYTPGSKGGKYSSKYTLKDN